MNDPVRVEAYSPRPRPEEAAAPAQAVEPVAPPQRGYAWLVWRLNRLRAMSAPEIAYRVRNVAVQWAERTVVLRADVPAPDMSASASAWVNAGAAGDAAGCIAAAERVLSGRLSLFALQDVDIGVPPRWNRDPLTGIEAPMRYGRSIDYRQPEAVGDIKYIWELNRHLQLVPLAQAYALTKDARYLEGLRVQLESWLEQCPRGMGVNWSSYLELGIRLINWSIVWQLIGGKTSPLFAEPCGRQLLQRWLASIYAHAHGIRHHLSRYSSANNHLIGEAAGLYLATLTWPYWSIFERWRGVARTVLEQECARQTYADGVNKEQASAYQQFVLEFFLVTGFAARAAGEPFSDGYWRRIEDMLEYLATLTDSVGNRPMIGDGDDGIVAGLWDDRAGDQGDWLLAAGACLFERPDWLHKARGVPEKARWLLPAERLERGLALLPRPAPPRRQVFPHGGYYLLGSELETAREIRALVDAGPLGYLSIAAHGHADALAFTLNIGGEEFLIDPGTYAYHRDRVWREYFRSTAAHNTLRIDGREQSVSGGNFMWRSKASARCEHWQSDEQRDEFVGSHDGYLSLSDPVLHRRRLQLDKPQRRLRVEDSLECRGEHQVEWFWHFAEHCRLRWDNGAILVEGERNSLRLRLPKLDAARVRIVRGAEQPPCGWVSRRFDVKHPTSTVVLEGRIRGQARVVTEIQC